MAIELVKRGQTVDLTKRNAGLAKITIGLSWGKATRAKEVRQEKSQGFFASLFGKAREAATIIVEEVIGDMDIDSSVLVLNEYGKKLDLVYYGHKTSQGIFHHGDDLTGSQKKGVYDNEEIDITLSDLPESAQRLIFIANIYSGESRKQDFSQVKGAYIRVLNANGREELVRYDLSDDYVKARGLVVGELVREGNEWSFKATGEGTPTSDLTRIVNNEISRGGR
jgi:stress response protein SCP2